MTRVHKLLVLEAKAPLLLSENPGARNVIRSLPYIPGTSLRGALAHRYLRSGGTPTDLNFGRLFLGTECVFGNLTVFPGATRSFVLPLTASSCKDHPGFVADGVEAHGARDVLADLWLAMAGKGSLVADLCGREGCGARRDRLTGFARWIARDQTYRRVFVPGYRRGHTEIADRLQSAQGGSLFFHEMLSEGSRFAGLVRCPPDLLDPIRNLLDDAVTLGAAGSRGLGLCSVVDWADPDPPEPLADRLAGWGQVAARDPDNPPSTFVVTCASDVILRDGACRSTTVGLPETLQAVAEILDPAASCALAGWSVAYHQSRIRLVSGWQASWGLPRPEAWAIAAGSTYVLRASAEPPLVHFSALLQTLEAVETAGIGERRGEGFGEIAICHPFHYRRGSTADGDY